MSLYQRPPRGESFVRSSTPSAIRSSARARRPGLKLYVRISQIMDARSKLRLPLRDFRVVEGVPLVDQRGIEVALGRQRLVELAELLQHVADGGDGFHALVAELLLLDPGVVLERALQ